MVEEILQLVDYVFPIWANALILFLKQLDNTMETNYYFKNKRKMKAIVVLASILFGACSEGNELIEDNTYEIVKAISTMSYPIVSTNQTLFYGNDEQISTVTVNGQFYGQDANYSSHELNYTDNQDGTITDNVTGLMWQKDPGDKMTYDEAVNGAANFDLAGYSDWRLPSIKELYSLIIFSGEDPSGYEGGNTNNLVPFINTQYFNFEYGNPNDGERIIDSQFATSNLDVGDSNFGGGNLMFGVNFADGRIKGYPTGPMAGQSSGKTFFVLYVRGNQDYGVNNFTDNGDGTISDLATGLMWMQYDTGNALDWEEALSTAEGFEFAGYSDWRLPDVKELQSIVDYSRAPGATNSAAIDPLFNCTQITNEAGQKDYPYYWSSTTHANMMNGNNAAYVSFGRAMGYFNGSWQDVHGAGAQRSDPKYGDVSEYPYGHGPQGDAIRINNYVRFVRNMQ